MSECFCGCGGPARFHTRSINKVGSVLAGDIVTVTSLLRAGMRSPPGREFADTGRQLCAVIADLVHRGSVPTPELERDARALMAFGRAHFAVAAVVEAVRRNGMSAAQAAQAIQAGEFDPFSQAPALPLAEAPEHSRIGAADTAAREVPVLRTGGVSWT